MKTILKILSKLFWLLIYAIIFIIISPILKLSIEGIPKTYVVLTGSMEPAIKPGSVSITIPTEPSTLSKGDIIAFASPDNYKDTIIHRIDSIKSKEPLRFSTKGDANDRTDNWDVVDVGVMGKHIFSIPYLGYAAGFIKTPLGFALAIVTPALLSIIRQIINIKKAIKEEIDKQVKQKTPPSSNNIFPLVFILTFISSFIVSKKFVYAVYTDTVTVSGLSITIADFDIDTTPPITQITTDLYSQTDPTFPIDYTITEDNPSHIDLCTSFNLEEWECVDRGLDNPINFTPSLGNGVYCFITIGHDLSGNTELKNLPDPTLLNPLDSVNYCTNFEVNHPQ
jgi:signal peptidase